MGLPMSKWPSMEWKHTESPVKKNVPGIVVSKEVLVDSVLRHKRTIDFLE